MKRNCSNALALKNVECLKIDLASWKSKIDGDKNLETKVVNEAYDHTKGKLSRSDEGVPVKGKRA